MYFTRTKATDWDIGDAIKFYEESGDSMPMFSIVSELKNLIDCENASKVAAAKEFMIALKEKVIADPAEGSSGAALIGQVNNIISGNGEINNNNIVTINADLGAVNDDLDGFQEPFSCDASPIHPGTPVADDQCFLDKSFVSDVHHNQRINIHHYKVADSWPSDSSAWLIGDCDIMAELKTFWEVSCHLNNTQGNIKDVRILSLHRIFTFLTNENESITHYIGYHRDIMNELDVIQTDIPTISSDLLVWCFSLATSLDDVTDLKRKCSDIMHDSYKKGDATDILATNVLFNLAPRAARLQDRYMIEDTFIHSYLDSLLEDLFSSDSTFYQSWANSSLKSCSDMKPDWMQYIRPWYQKIDITTCEVKPPGRQGNQVYSDFVKMALEMRGMLNSMETVIGSGDSMVFGILVEGNSLKTFAMDVKGCVYRLIQLGVCKLVTVKCDLGSFPLLFRCLLQVKNLASTVASKVKAAEKDRAKDKRPMLSSLLRRTYEVMEVKRQKRFSGES